MTTKQKIVLATLAILAYILPFSTRLPIWEYKIIPLNHDRG